MPYRRINVPESAQQALSRLTSECAIDAGRMRSDSLDALMYGIFGQKVYKPDIPEPVRVLYNGPCTIVFWSDGTKTIVRCAGDQEFDTYSGFVAAFAKKMFGSTSRVKKMLRKISNVEEVK